MVESDFLNGPPGGRIRQLRPSDFSLFRDHLLRLDADSRRDRFNGMADDALLADYAERCFREGTTVVGYVEGERVLGAAELHERTGEAQPTGEIAFSVEKERQHQGIGGRLFARLLLHALGLGYAQLRVTTHPNNAAMKALARRFNADLTFEEGETVGTIDIDADALALEPGSRAIREVLPETLTFRIVGELPASA